MEYQRIYAYETYKIHYFCKQTAHKGCLLLNIPYICPCYKCSRHNLGKRLALFQVDESGQSIGCFVSC